MKQGIFKTTVEALTQGYMALVDDKPLDSTEAEQRDGLIKICMMISEEYAHTVETLGRWEGPPTEAFLKYMSELEPIKKGK